MRTVKEKRAETREELRILYETTIADLAYFKANQWATTNYAITLYVGLVAAGSIASPLSGWLKLILLLFALAVFFAGLGVINGLRNDIEVRRDRLKKIRSQFGSAFRSARQTRKKSADIVPAVFDLVLAAGLFIVCLVLDSL